MRAIIICLVALGLAAGGQTAVAQTAAAKGAAAPAAPVAAPAASVAPAATPQSGPAAAQQSGPGTSSGDQAYVLGIGDTIDVSVLGRADFNTHVRIGADGSIVLPYLGAVKAVDRSPAQLAQDVAGALDKGGFFSNPSVRVDVSAVASRFVTVLGAASTPGLMALDRAFHLSEIVARAGGRGASSADYVVLTRGSSPPQKFKIADLATGAGDKDPLVENGDRIYFPTAEAETFYVQGAVKTPGAFALQGEMTVRTALARAGGLSETGSEKKVTINRKGKELKNVKLDETLVEAGDILTIGEKLF